MYKQIEKDFPIKLKMLRLDLRLSQEEFSKKVGISRSCLANYETGKRQPDIKMIQHIVQVCNVPLEVLTGSNHSAGIVLNESDQSLKKKLKILFQSRGNTLDISHLPTEHKISMFGYYDFIYSTCQKKKI